MGVCCPLARTQPPRFSHLGPGYSSLGLANPSGIIPSVINPPTPLILSLTFLHLINSSLVHSVFPKFHENLSITFYRAMHHSA